MSETAPRPCPSVLDRSGRSHRRRERWVVWERWAPRGARPRTRVSHCHIAPSSTLLHPLNRDPDTSHVPCKFYLQGQCQAGRTCPFSHDLESTTRPAPCKYFAKGHCKFGAKCALLHITPDGVVVNRRPFAPAMYAGNSQQAHAGAYPPPPGLLSLQAQGLDQRANGDAPPDEFGFPYRNGFDMPHIDYTHPSPAFGSPPQSDRFATSPPQKGLSVLDAPLPNSFDSNGVSLAARNGPFAASVPSRFGIESPPSSLPRKAHLGNTALQDLHSSAFGDRSNLDSVLAGSSPPSGGDEPLTFPKRPLHSERFRTSRPMISASVGTRLPSQSFEYSDDDADTDQEENLLPASLRDLIPEGRSRRESKGPRDDETPASFLAAQRRTLSSNTTPQESKVGSPSFSSSPSRYSGMFAQTRTTGPDFVGSPLRNAGLASASTSVPRGTNGDLGPPVSSPPRQASMSMLTQDLQRTKLDAARSDAARSYAGVAAHPPGPARTLSNGSTGRRSLDRAISTSSVGRERIDEEQELFDMEEIGGGGGDANKTAAPRSLARESDPAGAGISSRLHGMPTTRSEPSHGPIGSQLTK